MKFVMSQYGLLVHPSSSTLSQLLGPGHEEPMNIVLEIVYVDLVAGVLWMEIDEFNFWSEWICTSSKCLVIHSRDNGIGVKDTPLYVLISFVRSHLQLTKQYFSPKLWLGSEYIS